MKRGFLMEWLLAGDYTTGGWVGPGIFGCALKVPHVKVIHLPRFCFLWMHLRFGFRGYPDYPISWRIQIPFGLHPKILRRQ